MTYWRVDHLPDESAWIGHYVDESPYWLIFYRNGDERRTETLNKADYPRELDVFNHMQEQMSGFFEESAAR